MILPPATSDERSDGASSQTGAAYDLLADVLAHELGSVGVQVSRHVAGAAKERGVRFDLALWFCGPDGDVPRPSHKEVPARVHALLLGPFLPTPSELHRFDAILLLDDEELRIEVERNAKKAIKGAPPVVSVKLCLRPSTPRDEEKRARALPDQPVVLVQFDESFYEEIERVVFQLSLTNAPCTKVLLCPSEEGAKERARHLAQQQALPAYLVAGAEGFASTLGAVDLVIGRSNWVEQLLLAGFQVELLRLGGEGAFHSAHARKGRFSTDEISGVLHLASTLERRLADRGGSAARGTLHHAAHHADARALLDVFASLKPRPTALRASSSWEPIGPLADDVPVQKSATVEAKEASEKGAQNRAQSIENALDELKARLASGTNADDEAPEEPSKTSPEEAS
ncbi:MAG: hypothetical protein GY822_30765 [Deltaproteobacteria bacterium]|nr:hypothetical protein [Deltaproteobacteria bacterium]